jgi:hypothetical protein
MLAKSHNEAAPTRFSRVSAGGQQVWRTEFIGPPPSPVSSDSLSIAGSIEYRDPEPGELRPPQAFLVEQEAGAVVAPHFHFVDQFQVIVAGSGSLGRHPVAPLSVHFAAASTGYGPITPGDEGLSYFTMRASADQTGAQYLPDARPRMRAGVRRNVVVDRILTAAPEAVAARSQSAIETMLESEDGLAVFYMRIAPGDSMAPPAAAQSQGISMLVAAGLLSIGGQQYAAWSCLFNAPHEDPSPLQASPAGAEVLVMRYPRKPA